jgi:hypothetical protein
MIVRTALFRTAAWVAVVTAAVACSGGPPPEPEAGVDAGRDAVANDAQDAAQDAAPQSVSGVYQGTVMLTDMTVGQPDPLVTHPRVKVTITLGPSDTAQVVFEKLGTGLRIPASAMVAGTTATIAPGTVITSPMGMVTIERGVFALRDGVLSVDYRVHHQIGVDDYTETYDGSIARSP